MDCLTGNFTKYFKSINKLDLFLSFCRWKVLGNSANLNFWCIFSCIKHQTSTTTLSQFTGRQEEKKRPDNSLNWRKKWAKNYEINSVCYSLSDSSLLASLEMFLVWAQVFFLVEKNQFLISRIFHHQSLNYFPNSTHQQNKNK